jgi:hypothetical protein
MLPKKPHVYLTATLILLSGLFFDISIGRDAAITFKNLQWQCPYIGDKNYCEVSFQIVNHTPAQQVRKVTIRGIRVSPGEKGENARGCGRINFSILLKPKETIAIRELMPVESTPDNITVLIQE